MSEYTISRVCKVLQLNKSSYYYKKKRPASVLNAQAKAVIKCFKSNCGAYGRRRIRRSLLNKNIDISEYTIAKILKEYNLQSKHGRRKTTKNIYTIARGPRINRMKENLENKEVWATDISVVKIEGKYRYMSGVIEVSTRKIIGLKVYKTTPKAKQLVEEYKDLITIYKKPDILHSDNGSQYISETMCNWAEKEGIAKSYSKPHTPNDNQYIESYWKTMKTEIGKCHEYTQEEFELVARYYVKYYNERRLHSSIQYKTPNTAYKEKHAQASLSTL